MVTAITEPPHLETDLKTLNLSTVAAQWRPLAEQAARQGTQQVGGLEPQRADPLLPPLAVLVHLRGCVQPQVGDAQGDDFRDSQRRC